MIRLKFSIFSKILVLLILLTALPLSFLSYLSYANTKNLGNLAIKNANKIGEEASNDSTTELEKLGKEYIEEKARDTALVIKTYLSSKNLTSTRLNEDEKLVKLATAQVGQTGSTNLFECPGGIMRINKNNDYVNKDMALFKDTMPEWWTIYSKALTNCSEASGYYTWLDGVRVTKQYMKIVPVEGTKYMVSATTNIEEFSAPANITKDKINLSVKETTDNIELIKNNILKQTLIIIIITLVIAICVGFFFARSITKPIKKLTTAGNKVADGELETALPVIKSHDEISDLSNTINLLVGAIKFLKKDKTEKK